MKAGHRTDHEAPLQQVVDCEAENVVVDGGELVLVLAEADMQRVDDPGKPRSQSFDCASAAASAGSMVTHCGSSAI